MVGFVVETPLTNGEVGARVRGRRGFGKFSKKEKPLIKTGQNSKNWPYCLKQKHIDTSQNEYL